MLKCPAKILNITGPEILSVREVASEFGKLFGVKPRFINTEAETALLSNSTEAFNLFGRPKVPGKPDNKMDSRMAERWREAIGKAYTF